MTKEKSKNKGKKVKKVLDKKLVEQSMYIEKLLDYYSRRETHIC